MTINKSRLDKVMEIIQCTPLHPQWLVLSSDKKRRAYVGSRAKGILLDIGCADQSLKKYLKADASYVGLDYPPTGRALYHAKPSVFGDGQQLPVKSASIDVVAVLEVLEHVPDPGAVMTEIKRVMKPEGVCFLSIPFLYPIHDAPYDYQRLTVYGLREILKRRGFVVKREKINGCPIETAALLNNIALTKTIINAYENRNPVFILGLLLPVIIPILNILGWLSSKIHLSDNFMPHGYLFEVVPRT